MSVFKSTICPSELESPHPDRPETLSFRLSVFLPSFKIIFFTTSLLHLSYYVYRLRGCILGG